MMREQLSNQPHYDFGLPAIINFLKHIHNIKGTSVASSAVEVIFRKILKMIFFFRFYKIYCLNSISPY